MAALTSSSRALPRTNPAAQAALLLGVLALVAIPAGIAAPRYVERVTLLQGLVVSVPSAFVLALLAIVAARRARRTLTLTLGRCGGERTAAAARILGLVALYLACVGGIALGFYELLRIYS